MPIDVEQEIAEANARLPIQLPDRALPIEIQIRCIALAVAQRHVGDTCIKEGALYQQLKMDNKLGNVVSIDDVMRAALVFERYLWGEWSKGIAENALNATEELAAQAIEKEFKKRAQAVSEEEFTDEPPTRPSSGGPET